MPTATPIFDLIKRSITNYPYLGGDQSFEAFRCVTHYDLAQGQWSIDPLARPITLLTKGQLDIVEQAVLMMDELRVPGDFIRELEGNAVWVKRQEYGVPKLP